MVMWREREAAFAAMEVGDAAAMLDPAAKLAALSNTVLEMGGLPRAWTHVRVVTIRALED